MHINKKDFFLIPNILTYIRIILVPVFVLIYVNADSFSDNIWAAVIIVASGVTDVLDGFIARHWNMISDLGKIIDPIADKAMQFAMMICIVFSHHWVGLLIVIYTVKEVVSFIMSSYLFTRGKHIEGAMWCGKVCTVILFLVMLSLVVFPDMHENVITILIGFAAAFMILAFFVYMRTYFKLWIDYLNEQKEVLKTNMAPFDYVSTKDSDIINGTVKGRPEGENSEETNI